VAGGVGRTPTDVPLAVTLRADDTRRTAGRAEIAFSAAHRTTALRRRRRRWRRTRPNALATAVRGCGALAEEVRSRAPHPRWAGGDDAGTAAGRRVTRRSGRRPARRRRRRRGGDARAIASVIVRALAAHDVVRAGT